MLIPASLTSVLHYTVSVQPCAEAHSTVLIEGWGSDKNLYVPFRLPQSATWNEDMKLRVTSWNNDHNVISTFFSNLHMGAVWKSIPSVGHSSHSHLSLDDNQNKSCKQNFHGKSTLKTVAVFPLQMPCSATENKTWPQTATCCAVRDVTVSGRIRDVQLGLGYGPG